MSPTVTKVKRHNGVAGQFSYTAEVTYPDEAPSTITFVSSVYGPPIIMVTPQGNQIPVSTRVTDRLGSTLTPEWIRGFFA